MPPPSPLPVRARAFAHFHALPPEGAGGQRRWLMQAHNFATEWIEAERSDAAAIEFGSECESLLIVHTGAVRITLARPDAPKAEARAHTVSILPSGHYTLELSAGSEVALIASQRNDAAGRRIINAEACDPRDPRVAPVGRPYRRLHSSGAVQVLDIDAIQASIDKPRLKMLQTESMSINIVEYDGPRDRRQLSPHKHANFEQGSLAIAGTFVHHLRVPWSNDAGEWRDDEHLQAPSPSLLVVPVEMIHTTEGVGPEHHFLVDIFSPPRTDFIDKGWVFNAADYRSATLQGASDG